MSSLDLNVIINQIVKDKGISREVLVEAVESAMLSAAKKIFGHNLNLETQLSEESGAIEVLQFKTVVAEVLDADNELSVDQAREEYDPEAMVGDEFGKKLDTTELGRIAAQTAKQVIMQKLRDAERDVIYTEFKDSKGQIVSGIVQRYERGNLIVNLGRTEAVVPRMEQIQKERYRQGDRLRGMILDIDPSGRGPQVILTRSHPDFLIKLLELEVPEIVEGTVVVKACAREAGERAKVAVVSMDPSVDAQRVCVGVKGSKLHSVSQELHGERVEIVPWTADEPSFVAKALAPAEIARVIIDDDAHSMEVIVPDDQLAFAIGKRGQNVKLATKLTGWTIDVRSVTVAEEEAKRSRAAIATIPGLHFTDAERLYQAGFRGVKDIAEANIDDLLELDGFDESTVHELIRNAQTRFTEMANEEEEALDISKLKLDDDLKTRLTQAELTTLQSILAADDAKFISSGFTEFEIATIRDAGDKIFQGTRR